MDDFLSLLRHIVSWPVWDGDPDRREPTSRLLSGRVRQEEDPSSAALHVTLDEKEYMLILQPTDLPDAGGPGE